MVDFVQVASQQTTSGIIIPATPLPTLTTVCGNLGIRTQILSAIQRAQVRDPICLATCLTAGYTVVSTVQPNLGPQVWVPISVSSAYSGTTCACWSSSAMDDGNFIFKGNQDKLTGTSFSQAAMGARIGDTNITLWWLPIYFDQYGDNLSDGTSCQVDFIVSSGTVLGIAAASPPRPPLPRAPSRSPPSPPPPPTSSLSTTTPSPIMARSPSPSVMTTTPTSSRAHHQFGGSPLGFPWFTLVAVCFASTMTSRRLLIDVAGHI